MEPVREPERVTDTVPERERVPDTVPERVRDGDCVTCSRRGAGGGGARGGGARGVGVGVGVGERVGAGGVGVGDGDGDGVGVRVKEGGGGAPSALAKRGVSAAPRAASAGGGACGGACGESAAAAAAASKIKRMHEVCMRAVSRGPCARNRRKVLQNAQIGGGALTNGNTNNIPRWQAVPIRIIPASTCLGHQRAARVASSFPLTSEHGAPRRARGVRPHGLAGDGNECGLGLLPPARNARRRRSRHLPLCAASRPL
jgi:hypothetical protein